MIAFWNILMELFSGILFKDPLVKQMEEYIDSSSYSSDATGLGRTRQKPDLDYFLQTETRTRFFNITPNQTRRLISDENKYKNPTKNPNPAEPEAKVQTDPKPEPDWLNPSRSRTRLFETRCVTSFHQKCL